MEFPSMKQVSECFIKPKYQVRESKLPYYLSPLDLIFLSAHYNQKGLLFKKPNQEQEAFNIQKLLESLKDSLASTLVHFYPLAGQLEVAIDEDQGTTMVFVDCNKGSGVRFVHATLDMTVSDIISPLYVPTEVVSSLFDHNCGEVNLDGLTRPLLSIYVTELVDGIFIGLSMNHAIADGTSFWQFWNVWSEIHRANNGQHLNASRLPVLKRWFPAGYGPQDASIPFTNVNESIERYMPPQVKERIFHFSSETIAKLKARANKEVCNVNNNNNSNSMISSFQALIALTWRAITRAKGLKPHQLTCCKLAANNRSKLNPPLPQEYFGNLLSVLSSTTTVGEILEHDLGWTASLLHQSVINHSEKDVIEFTLKWVKSPHRFVGVPNDADCVLRVGSSPRFNVYGNEFAELGKPIAVRCGYANKFDGKITIFPGYQGGGSVDLEICLKSDFMSALVSDQEFMAAVSLP